MKLILNVSVFRDPRFKKVHALTKRLAMQNQYHHDNDTFAIICTQRYDGPFKYNHIKSRQNVEFVANSYKYLKPIEDGQNWFKRYIMIRKFGYLYEIFEMFMLRIHQNGIHMKLTNHDQNFPDLVDPKVVLTLQMLSAGFYLWLFCVAMSCIVFLCEMIVGCFKNRVVRDRRVSEFKL